MKKLLIGILTFGSISAYSAEINLRNFEKCSDSNIISLSSEYQGTYLASSGESVTLDSEGLSKINTSYISAGSNLSYEIYSNMCVHQKITGSRLVVTLKTSESLFWEGGLKQKIVIKLRDGLVQVGQNRTLKTGFMKNGVSIHGGSGMQFVDMKKSN